MLWKKKPTRKLKRSWRNLIHPDLRNLRYWHYVTANIVSQSLNRFILRHSDKQNIGSESGGLSWIQVFKNSWMKRKTGFKRVHLYNYPYFYQFSGRVCVKKIFHFQRKIRYLCFFLCFGSKSIIIAYCDIIMLLMVV